MVDRRHPSLSVVHQCRLLGISRSGLYYQPAGISEEDLTLMKLIDHQYLATPFYGARKIAAWLRKQGHKVNRKRVRRLMRTMGLKAIYRRPRTSQPAPGHIIYPYLLSNTERPNQTLGYLTQAEVFTLTPVEAASRDMIESLASDPLRIAELNLNIASILS